MHRVPDYSGATKEEREQRIDDIISMPVVATAFSLATAMAEDEQMVAAMDDAASIYRALLSHGPAGGRRMRPANGAQSRGIGDARDR